MWLFVMSVLVAAEAEAPLTLERAILLAAESTRDLVRARADVLLVDVERLRARAQVLPRVDLSLSAGATLNGAPIIEQRVFRTPIFCDPTATTMCPRGAIDPNSADGQDLLARGFESGRTRSNGFVDTEVTDTYFDPFFRGSLVVRQLVYDGGRYWTAFERVADLDVQRRAIQRAVENNVRLAVVRAFYGYVSARQAVEIFRAQIAAAEANLSRLRAEDNQKDLALTERNLSDDRVTQARRELNLARAARTLNLTLARRADHPFEVQLPEAVQTATASLARWRLPDATEVEAIARRHRPDLRAAEATVALQEKAVTVASADYLPQVSVGATYSRASRKPGRFWADPSENFYLGLDLTVRWNLFRGLGTYADVTEAMLLLIKSRADQQEVERNVMAEVGDRLQALRISLDVHDLARRTAEVASAGVQETRMLYAAGLKSVLELRDAELGYSQARLGVINARLDVELAREDLRRVVGVDLFE